MRITPTQSHAAAFLAGILLTAAIGCSGGEETGSTLSGSVLFNGEPVPNAMLQFVPQGDGSSAVASADADGRYEAKMSRSMAGIEPGTYDVTISGNITQGGQTVSLPRRYADAGQSGLTVFIEPDTEVRQDFELTGETEEAQGGLGVVDDPLANE